MTKKEQAEYARNLHGRGWAPWRISELLTLPIGIIDEMLEEPGDAEVATPNQPQVTEFTLVVPSPTRGGVFYLRVKLNSGQTTEKWIKVAEHPSRDEAEEAELAINQVMVEYRIKRNDWNDRH